MINHEHLPPLKPSKLKNLQKPTVWTKTPRRKTQKSLTLARCARNLPLMMTSTPLAPFSMMNLPARENRGQ
jgi:hypothetical protein